MITIKHINEQLMDAVSGFDLPAVRKLLSEGADASYWRYRDEEETSGLMQPTTPLRLVVFRISDCDLTDEQLKIFAAIAKVLVEHGADPQPAMQLAEIRYGQYDPSGEGPFMEVWHVIAGAMKN